jgi:hypothetical protein
MEMKQKIWRLTKWIINIVALVNLILLISKAPSYQKQITKFEGQQNECKVPDWSIEKQNKCIANVLYESSKYIDNVRSNTTWGLYLPVIFYGAIALYKDYLLALKEA